MELDRRDLTPPPNPTPLTPPAALPLDPADVPLVYATILRTVLDRVDASEAKAVLRAELGCSRSALDGVHAQLTKDVATVYAACLDDAQQWGAPADVLRLAARSVRAHGADPDWEPLAGVREVVDAYGAVCHRRGVGVLWEELTGGHCRWATVLPAGSSPYRGAAHSDFDFPAKIAWRREWEAFLRQHLADLPPDALGRLRVICLASKDPRREVAIYLRLGIRPEQVVAVEGDAEAARELKQNCRILGGGYERIQVVASDLLRFVKKPHEPFDIISLDFHGCAGFDKVEISRHLRAAPRHYVLVNLEAAREKPLGQQLIRESHDLARNLLAHMEGRLNRETGAPRPGGLGRNVTLEEAREDGLSVMDLGHGHWTERSSLSSRLWQFEKLFSRHGTVLNRKFPHVVSPQAELDCHASEAAAALGRVVYEHLMDPDGSDLSAAEVAYQLYQIYQAEVYRPPALHGLRRFAYRSEASHVGQTYLSTFAALKPGTPSRPPIRAVAEFLVAYATTAFENYVAHPEWNEFRNQGVSILGRLSKSGQPLLQAFRVEDGTTRLEGPVLSAVTIFQAVDEFRRLAWPHVARASELCAKPREFISG